MSLQSPCLSERRLPRAIGRKSTADWETRGHENRRGGRRTRAACPTCCGAGRCSRVRRWVQDSREARSGPPILMAAQPGLAQRRLWALPEAWQTAVSNEPGQSLAFGNLADLYSFDLGQYEKAEEYYLKVLNMRSDNYGYYVGLTSLYRYHLTEKANLIESIMIKGAENNPAEAENYYMYLANYFASGSSDKGGDDKEKAKYYGQKVLKIDPNLKDQLFEI